MNYIIMSKIEMKDCVYHVHPIHDLYPASKDGNIIHIVKQRLMKGYDNPSGYLYFTAWKKGQKGNKTYRVHRFVWECYNGLIPDGKVIDHINDIKDDNRLCNLQLSTPQQNNNKSVKNVNIHLLKISE